MISVVRAALEDKRFCSICIQGFTPAPFKVSAEGITWEMSEDPPPEFVSYLMDPQCTVGTHAAYERALEAEMRAEIDDLESGWSL